MSLRTLLLVYVVITVLVAAGLVFCMTWERRHAARRLRLLIRRDIQALDSARSGYLVFSLAAAVTRRIQRLFAPSAQGEDKTKSFLENAGIRGGDSLNMYLGTRLLAPLAGFCFGAMVPIHRGFWCLSLAALFYLAPDTYMRRRTSAYHRAIRQSLPEALDLLVICVEAGLGIDQALIRVSDEIQIRHPALSEEFSQVNLEQRAGKPRVQAWRTMANRMDIAELTSFVAMLSQADRFGTPIARALSEFAANLRERRRQAAEQRAAKTSVKIIFPLVFFIFPAIFVVLLGPAVLTMFRSLGSIGK